MKEENGLETIVSLPIILTDAQLQTWAVAMLKKNRELAERYIAQYIDQPLVQKLLKQALQFLDTYDHANLTITFFNHVVILTFASTEKTDITYALQLSSATTFFVAGLKLLDDQANQQLTKEWLHLPPTVFQLVTQLLMDVLPQLIIADLPVLAIIKNTLSRLFSDYANKIFSGQITTIELAQNSLPSNFDKINIAKIIVDTKNKVGAYGALCGALGVALRGADINTIQQYAQFGMLISIMKKLSQDAIDLFMHQQNEILFKIDSLPIIFYLETLNKKSRQSFLELLLQSKKNKTARAKIRDILLATKQRNNCLNIINDYQKEALALLEKLHPAPIARFGLEKKITLSAISADLFIKNKQSKTKKIRSKK